MRAVLYGSFDIADILWKEGKATKNYINKLEGKSLLDVAIENK